MRPRLLVLPAILALLAGVPRIPAASIAEALTTSEKQRLQREARLVVDLLQNYHYSGMTFHELPAREMIDRFVSELDPEGELLTGADVEFIHQRFDHTLKAVYLLRGDLQPAFEIFDLFAERARARIAWIDHRLDGDFDFTVAQTYTAPAKDRPRLASAELDAFWELRLKAEVLSGLLAGRDLAAARAKVREDFADMRRGIGAVDALVVRERFFDSVIRSFDPHSGYFSVESARNFETEMENAVVGVGVNFDEKHGRCIVTGIFPGGPADLGSDLRPGDRLEKVASGAVTVNASRSPLRDVVAVFSGEPGTKVQLTYRHADEAATHEIELERRRLILGRDRARGAIVSTPGAAGVAKPIGWIALPSFYAAGTGPTATSATRDVRELLERMMGQGMAGLVLDLRGNPGGALNEAVSLSELFIPRGRILISRSLDGPREFLDAREGKPVWNGPLVILTSWTSASASEVFSGAMQYYRRAVIVGPGATYGKGTMQNYIDLARAMPNLPARDTASWGTLRLTAQRFFLPDGHPVQRAGVKSDVILPDFSDAAASREETQAHALGAEADALSDAPPAPAPAQATIPAGLVETLRATAGADVAALPEWKLWCDEEKSWHEQEGQTVFDLRKDEREQLLAADYTAYAAREATRRKLSATDRWPTQAFDLAMLAPDQAAHEAKLRALKTADGTSPAHHLVGDAFFIENEAGRLEDVSLEQFDFRRYYGDAETLAAAFGAGAGRSVAPGDVRAALIELQLLEVRTGDAALAVLNQRVANGALAAEQLRAGTERLLDRAVELDGGFRAERPRLDVPLRECLRLALAWADLPPAAVKPPAAP